MALLPLRHVRCAAAPRHFSAAPHQIGPCRRGAPRTHPARKGQELILRRSVLTSEALKIHRDGSKSESALRTLISSARRCAACSGRRWPPLSIRLKDALSCASTFLQSGAKDLLIPRGWTAGSEAIHPHGSRRVQSSVDRNWAVGKVRQFSLSAHIGGGLGEFNQTHCRTPDFRSVVGRGVHGGRRGFCPG